MFSCWNLSNSNFVTERQQFFFFRRKGFTLLEKTDILQENQAHLYLNYSMKLIKDALIYLRNVHVVFVNKITTYRFKSTIHDSYLLSGEFGESAEVLQSDRNGFRHSWWFYFVHHFLDGTVRRCGHLFCLLSSSNRQHMFSSYELL